MAITRLDGPQCGASSRAERGEPLVDEREVGGVVGAVRTGASCTQSGNPPLRTSPWHHGPMRSTTSNPSRSHSATNAATSSPPPKSRCPRSGFVVVPEHVGGHDGDAARAHEAQALLPLVARHPAVVHLARDRDRRAAVDLDVPVREGEAVVPVDRVAHRGPRQRAVVRSVRHAERAPAERDGGADVTACGSFDCVRSQFYHGRGCVPARARSPPPRVTDSDG